jgi:hypothetical protein
VTAGAPFAYGESERLDGMAGAFGSLAAAAGFASDALEPAAGFFAVAAPSAAQSGVVSARPRHEARAIERLRVVGTAFSSLSY